MANIDHHKKRSLTTDLKEGDSYLSHWLNKFIQTGLCPESSLLYQELHAYINMHLLGTDHIQNWQKYPSLYSFCSSMLTHAGLKGYRFFLGAGRFNKQRDMVKPTDRCFVGPHERTLQDSLCFSIHEDTTRHDNIAAMIQLLDGGISDKGRITGKQMTKHLVTRTYDEQPLSAGTFVRVDKEKQEVYLDGIRPIIEAENLKECCPQNVNKLVYKDHAFVTEVREHMVQCVTGKLTVNAHTSFHAKAVKGEHLVTESPLINAAIETCLSC